MVLGTLTLPERCLTSSLSARTSIISTWPSPDERRPTSTLAGDHRSERLADDDDETRQWAEITRHAQVRWAKDNPY